MDLGSLFLLLALLILIAAFIARPLIERKAMGVSEEEQSLSTWLARRDRVLDALQELDFDYRLGKIPETDYPTQRAILLQQGADILKHLDTLQPRPQPRSADTIETAIAARRKQAGAGAGNGTVSNGVPLPDDDIESMLAVRRRTHKSKFTGFCAQCGNPLHGNDKFCSKCGAKA
ncbi:MAG TPA: zinc ribbon domain-containing protein [Anaerolineales bacterium]|nr:zinc ribbon domain-containing protein [Anaerolineales bacterium]